MKIWGGKTGGNPLRVALFLAEKGIDIPFEPVDLIHGAHRDPTFRAKNPVGLVPVLELDDGTCISETIAICRYFERLHPEPPLMGSGALDEATVEMWQRRVEFHLYAPAREVFRHTIPFVKALEPVQMADWAELNRPRVAAGLKVLNEQLKDHRYVAGERYSVADITALFSCQMLAHLHTPIPDDHGPFLRWRAEVYARPSVVSVLGEPKT